MTDVPTLENLLGIHFKDQKLLLEALTHRSYLNEHPQTRNSNERLEFLGDSVLSLIISTELFQRFPKSPEGNLTGLRSNLVRAKTLSTVAQHLKLGEYLLMSRGEEKSGGRKNPSLLANTFEAVLGAIYLDHGLPSAKTFLEKYLFPNIPQAIKETEIYDFKSRLQEVTQEKNRVSPIYRVISETGPDHDKTFTVGVYVNRALLSNGTGKSKQEAEQSAARAALEKV